MISALAEPWAWSQRRRWLTLACVFLGQVGFIFWLSGRDPAPQPGPRAQRIVLPADRICAMPGLDDPTLFALPNRLGFSASAWLQKTSLERPSLEWTEPPCWLPQQAARLGAPFCEFIATNLPNQFEVVPHAELEIVSTNRILQLDLAPAQSTARVVGDLAGRRLVEPLSPPSWPAAELVLAASEIAIGVLPDGTVCSAKLLKSCGAKDADNEALKLARSARFEGLPRFAVLAPGGLSWGTLVVDWRTLAPASNSSAAR
jgi:TonB family protein